jgi:hypothetical protein
MAIFSEMTKADLEATLAGFKRFYEASRHAYDQKYLKFEELRRDLDALADEIKSVKGSIIAVERALGLSPEQIRLPETPELRRAGKPLGVTEGTMRIVADKNDTGGLTFDEILKALHEQGFKTLTREYLHTILNRKKNYQKKLYRDENKRWFLTEKGKEEVGG